MDTVIDLDRVIDYIEEQLGESFAVDKVGERQIFARTSGARSTIWVMTLSRNFCSGSVVKS